MTQNHDQIIAEYRDADFNRRLHIYLQFPHLRSKFIVMDQNDLNVDLSAGFKWPRYSLADQLSAVFCSAGGCVKKLLGIAAT
jgi:hypothetical protein